MSLKVDFPENDGNKHTNQQTGNIMIFELIEISTLCENQLETCGTRSAHISEDVFFVWVCFPNEISRWEEMTSDIKIDDFYSRCTSACINNSEHFSENCRIRKLEKMLISQRIDVGSKTRREVITFLTIDAFSIARYLRVAARMPNREKSWTGPGTRFPAWRQHLMVAIPDD